MVTIVTCKCSQLTKLYHVSCDISIIWSGVDCAVEPGGAVEKLVEPYISRSTVERPRLIWDPGGVLITTFHSTHLKTNSTRWQ